MEYPCGSLALPAALESVREFRAFARQGVTGDNFSEDDLGRLDLILEELLVNIVRYSHPNGDAPLIELSFRLCAAGLVEFTLTDSDLPFNPLEAPQPSLDQPLEDRNIGGLGIFLVRELCKSMAYQRLGPVNHLTFEFQARPKDSTTPE